MPASLFPPYFDRSKSTDDDEEAQAASQWRRANDAGPENHLTFLSWAVQRTSSLQAMVKEKAANS